MESTIPEKLSENTKMYFTQLKKYINTPIYFYGSVVRDDYYPHQSDIDVCIFYPFEYNGDSIIINKILEFIFLFQDKENIYIKNKDLYVYHSKNIINVYSFIFFIKKINSYVDFKIYNPINKLEICYIRHTFNKYHNLYFVIIRFIKYFFYNLKIINHSTYVQINEYLKTIFFTKYCVKAIQKYTI